MIQIKLTKLPDGLDRLEITRFDGSVIKVERKNLAEETIYRFTAESELGIEGVLGLLGGGAKPFPVPRTPISAQVEVVIGALRSHRQAETAAILEEAGAVCLREGIAMPVISDQHIQRIRQKATHLLEEWKQLTGNGVIQMALSRTFQAKAD